ncbi:Trafficking protein particle complex subunit 12 [Portunus trituberculatus]|uniref:Trafficking protein particle complex subunit 12 n=1 Tax=Portunus trituberculatus TaxID=210409 RepID=A0A5B7FYL9_PORTR|nr:Trafficking protein particle complex subunit 12 [Portunus trituberculatus]
MLCYVNRWQHRCCPPNFNLHHNFLLVYSLEDGYCRKNNASTCSQGVGGVDFLVTDRHKDTLWFTRIALLVKLRRFSLAEVECQYFNDLDAPDLYFEFYPELYGGRKGSMVPFGFRLLVAELPQHLGKHTQALDRLNALLRTCNEVSGNIIS